MPFLKRLTLPHLGLLICTCKRLLISKLLAYLVILRSENSLDDKEHFVATLRLEYLLVLDVLLIGHLWIAKAVLSSPHIGSFKVLIALKHCDLLALPHLLFPSVQQVLGHMGLAQFRLEFLEHKTQNFYPSIVHLPFA